MSENFVPGLGVTNIFIQNVLEQSAENFIGVFSSNELGNILPNSGSFVINLSPSGTLGSHFVTVVARKTDVLYIDSLGLPCTNDNIKKILKSFMLPIKENQVQIQHFKSIYCGFYCILFCIYYDKERKENLIFSKNLLKNDQLCIEYIKMFVRQDNKV